MKILLLLLFWCMWFFNFSARTVLSPLLPVLEEDLGMGHTLSGSLFFCLSAGYTLSLLATGWLTARLGSKKSIVCATCLFALALSLLRFATSYAYLAAISFFMGLGAGVYLPSALPLLTSVFRRESWGKALAFHETAPTFSFLAVPLLAAVALQFFTWQDFILAFAGVSVIASGAFALLAPPTPPHGGKGFDFRRLLGNRLYWVTATLWSTASASVVAVYNVTPLLLVNERGVALETANTVLGVSRAGAFFATFLVGFLVDRYGTKKLLFLCLLFTGLSTLGIALARPLPLLMALFLLQSAFSLVFFPIGLVALSKMTTPEERSLFTGGVMAASVVFGGGIVPFAVAALGDIWSFQTGILLLGVFVILSSLLLNMLKDFREE